MRFLIFLIISSYSIDLYSQVVHVSPNNSSAADGFYYSLPRTVVKADVTIFKKTHTPGPLFEYAENYLGYRGVESQYSKFEIADIKLSSIAEPDPDHIYFIETNSKQKIYAELDELGILKRINLPSTEEEKKEYNIEKVIKEQVISSNEKNLTLINLKEKSDTIFKRQILEDSVVVESRQIERVFIKSSKEESAKEAAKMISDIRQQKYKLISYSDEITYDAKSIEIMLKELNQLEEAYFQLFLGKTTTEILHYQFSFIPSSGDQGFQPLFKFNQNSGVNDSLKLMMETVYIVTEKSQNGTSELIKKFSEKNENIKKTKSTTHGIAYRIPESVTIKIMLNNQLLNQSKMNIAQLGTIQYLGADQIENTKLYIDSKTGNIRSIGIN